MPEMLIHRRFEAQAAARPDAVAVQSGDQSLTYAELDDCADTLANLMMATGVGPDLPVGIFTERSLETIIGILGILKAGGAYLPLEPSYPAERLRLMLEDAQPAVVLTQERLVEKLPDIDVPVVTIDRLAASGALRRERGSDLRAPLRKASASRLTEEVTGDHLAYLPYTSGSTGAPRGVEIVHHSIVRLVCDNDYAHFGPDETFLHLAPLAFDASSFEIWGALLNGARLALAPPGPVSLPTLGELLRRHQVTTLWLTAGLFHLMVDERLDDLCGLGQLLAGGDVLSVRHCRRVRERFPHLRLINGYGPTEATTFACCQMVADLPANAERVPIGRPIAGTFVAVLDEHGQPVMDDSPGELYIGGAGLARGYRHRPDLTAERFVAHPFEPGVRLYRTGDRVCRRDDGGLEFLGRVDAQVKIRGYRVEPAEVEAALAAHPAVAQAAVAAREDDCGNRRLLAWYVPRGNSADLAAHLHSRLPDYMMPAALIPVAELPLTANGKIDRSRLRELEFSSEPDLLPIDPIRQRLRAIWNRLLPPGPLPLDLPFLSAGGDSLSALRLLAEIQREFGRELGVAAVLDGGSINRLAELLGQPGAESRALVPIQPNGCRPPLYLVHPLGGQVMGFRPLARHLGPAQPVYGLQALGAGSIEEMASRYIAEVVAHQPIAPLHLGGYSMGAYIAFEMARLARERGREVGLLAAIDDGPALLRPRPRTSLLELAGFLANAPRWLHHQATQRRWSEPFRDAGRKLRSWIRQLAGSGASLDEVLDASLYTDRQRDLMAAHYTALRNYRPRPYQGAMILFRARVQPLLGAHEADLGWKALVQRGIGIEVVPGNHDLILSEPWVVHLAAGLSRHLQAPSRRAAA